MYNNQIATSQSLALIYLNNLQEAILDEFLPIATRLNKQLTLLLKNGIDPERSVYLEKREQTPSCYSHLPRNLVDDFQKSFEDILNTSDKKSIPENFFNFIIGKSHLLGNKYDEIFELFDLSQSYHHVHIAINEIKLVC